MRTSKDIDISLYIVRFLQRGSNSSRDTIEYINSSFALIAVDTMNDNVGA